jgi:glycosyltransferase involved in cell wall biosynthesis
VVIRKGSGSKVRLVDGGVFKAAVESGKKMKLLFVHQNFGAFAGAEMNILITAAELQQRGHELGMLYARDTGRSQEKWAEAFPQNYALTDGAQTVSEVLEKFAPDLIYLHSLDDLEAMEALVNSSVPVIRMVHDHSLYCLRSYKYNPLTRTICTRAASPYCVFPCLAPVARNRDGGFPVKLASYSALRNQMQLTKRCAALIVYSEYSKAELVRNGFTPDNIHVHVPIDCWGHQGARASFSDRNLLLFAGQIIRGKGVDILLKALAQVRMPFECLIAGDGNHRATCEKLTRKLGLQDRVRFTGYLPPEQLRELYLDASIFLMSSVWPEPFGMAGPEAMRYGVPVVAFDAGGIREWLIDGENGYLAPWMDKFAFAAGVEALLGNKALARHMGERGLEYVNRSYDSHLQVNTLEDIFYNTAAPSVRESAARTLVLGQELAAEKSRWSDSLVEPHLNP